MKKKLKGGLFGNIWKISKKSHKAEKSHSAEKSENFLLQNTLAHTHGFEHETSGLKSKHLTTRPRTHEMCDLPREMRELSRGNKNTRTFP